MNETAEMNIEQNAAAQIPSAEQPVDVDTMSDADFENYLAGEYDAGGEASDNTIGQTVEPSSTQDDVSSAEGDSTEDSEGDSSDGTPPPYKSFATQEDWQRTIDRIIGERLRGSHETAREYDSLKRTIADYYGTEDADRAVKMLLDDMTEQTAQNRGIDADTYRRLRESEQQNRQYQEQLQQMQQQTQQAAQQRQIAAIQEDWQKQAAQLQKTAADFDLEKYMQNKEFVGYVVNSGLPIADAYYLVNRTQQMQQARQRAEAKKERKPVHENGAGQAPGGSAYRDVSKMSDADFEKYIDELM